MDFSLTAEQERYREGVRELCAKFSEGYWRELDAHKRYPDEFVHALTDGGWLAVMIPAEYGGAGLGIVEACIVLEEVNASGGNAAACHAQIYTMGALLRHGSEAQKRLYLPDIAAGRLRLQSMAITEPEAGSDTSRITTFARKVDDGYLVNGQKVFTSRVQHSDLLLLLARTTRAEDVERRTDGLSLFLVDLRQAGSSIEVRPIETMVNHETNGLFITDLPLPQDALVGEEGGGFRQVLDGLNAERILIASESIGDARWFVERSVAYAGDRVVFGRPIGANQGVQFPIARAFMHAQAASLMRWQAATLFDAGKGCGPEANMAKLLASEAAWEAADMAMTTFGGSGMAVEVGIERKFREARLYLVAPVTNNLVTAYVAEHVLGLPRSYGMGGST
ncbi:MAG TPA: acyl-CoA dehydrogenase family protein [Candidatus Dormibacteraeota bacterium]|nr:acyl-CoA dehydrogenase family protein [Candidatus Dormibacteraeota bacterium]